MPAYRLHKTTFTAPDALPVPGAPAQGQRVNTEGIRILDYWGTLQPVSAEPETSAFGQGARQYFRWRGRLPEGIEPMPGWELEIGEHRYRVITAVSMCGRAWRLDLERIE